MISEFDTWFSQLLLEARHAFVEKISFTHCNSLHCTDETLK